MATLDVTGVYAVQFTVDTTITPASGNDYVWPANTALGVPRDATSMTISPASTSVACMTAGAFTPSIPGAFLQVMTIDETRATT